MRRALLVTILAVGLAVGVAYAAIPDSSVEARKLGGALREEATA